MGVVYIAADFLSADDSWKVIKSEILLSLENIYKKSSYLLGDYHIELW